MFSVGGMFVMFVMYTVHRRLYTVHCTFYNVHCTVYTRHISHTSLHIHIRYPALPNTPRNPNTPHTSPTLQYRPSRPFLIPRRFTHSSRVRPRPSLGHTPAAEQYNNSRVTQYTDYCVISQIHIAPLCSRD